MQRGFGTARSPLLVNGLPLNSGGCLFILIDHAFLGHSRKHHLYLDINPETGALTFNFPDLEPHEMGSDASCSLDAAQAGGMTLEKVGDAINVTRERIRQIEIRYLWKLRWANQVREFGVDGPMG